MGPGVGLSNWTIWCWCHVALPLFLLKQVSFKLRCTDLHRVWVCKVDDGEFEFVYHFNNYFNSFRSFLSLHVATWKTLSFSVYWSVHRNRKRGSSFSNDVIYFQTRVNRPTFLCTYLKRFAVHVSHYLRYFHFQSMDENNLHCSVMKVLCCAIGFCKETSEQRMKTFFIWTTCDQQRQGLKGG